MREADRAKDELKAVKKGKPLDAVAIAASEAAIREMVKEARESTSKADDIENAVYDLKATNPHRQPQADHRTPDELLDLIETQGRTITEALGTLRKLVSDRITD